MPTLIALLLLTVLIALLYAVQHRLQGYHTHHDASEHTATAEAQAHVTENPAKQPMHAAPTTADAAAKPASHSADRLPKDH